MLLALDVGNTNVVGGLYDGRHLVTQWRVSTTPQRTADELHVLWDGLLRTRNLTLSAVDGACLASVVPSLTGSYRELAEQRIGVPTVVISNQIDLGIGIDTDNPPEVGADRLMNALAARERYGAPAVVADFGTSTNFDVVGPTGDFVGGVIAPGMAASVEALVARTAQLHRIALQRPPHAIGRNTTASMQSGAFFGYVGLVEGILERILAELGGRATVVATGGLAGIIVPETKLIEHVDPDLTLEGIRLVWERHRPHPPTPAARFAGPRQRKRGESLPRGLRPGTSARTSGEPGGMGAEPPRKTLTQSES
jgi:type III pantothenate kinase